MKNRHDINYKLLLSYYAQETIEKQFSPEQIKSYLNEIANLCEKLKIDKSKFLETTIRTYKTHPDHGAKPEEIAIGQELVKMTKSIVRTRTFLNNLSKLEQYTDLIKDYLTQNNKDENILQQEKLQIKNMSENQNPINSNNREFYENQKSKNVDFATLNTTQSPEEGCYKESLAKWLEDQNKWYEYKEKEKLFRESDLQYLKKLKTGLLSKMAALSRKLDLCHPKEEKEKLAKDYKTLEEELELLKKVLNEKEEQGKLDANVKKTALAKDYNTLQEELKLLKKVLNEKQNLSNRNGTCSDCKGIESSLKNWVL